MPAVTAILHAENWPAPTAIDALKHRLREACGNLDLEVEVVEARDPRKSPRGAAAAINQAARGARGPILLVVPATNLPESEDLRALVAAARHGVAVGQPVRGPATGSDPSSADRASEGAAGPASGVGHEAAI